MDNQRRIICKFSKSYGIIYLIHKLFASLRLCGRHFFSRYQHLLRKYDHFGQFIGFILLFIKTLRHFSDRDQFIP